MNIGRNWRIPPIRQSLSNVLWKSQETNEVISPEIDAKLGLKPNRKVAFNNVEEFVNNFVEEVVPYFVDELYKFCDEIKALKEADLDDEELRGKCMEANKVVQELKVKVGEIDKLRDHVRETDHDDFDLRVQPTKSKINKAVVNFLEVNSEVHVTRSLPCTSHASLSRSHKARDLLSYLSSEESENFLPQRNEQSSHDEPVEVLDYSSDQLQQLKQDEITEESLELLNKDLVDLHAMMNDLHAAVHDQGQVVDTIADNIERAEDNIEEGNKSLKRAAILKAAMFPIVGAVVGGVVGGPIGLVAGMKVGSVTSGLAMAGVTGSVIGYQGGKFLKKKHQDEVVDNEKES